MNKLPELLDKYWGKYVTLENYNSHRWFIPTLAKKWYATPSKQLANMDPEYLFYAMAELLIKSLNNATNNFIHIIGGLDDWAETKSPKFDEFMERFMSNMEYFLRNEHYGWYDRAAGTFKAYTNKYDALDPEFVEWLRQNKILGVKSREEIWLAIAWLKLDTNYYTIAQVEKRLSEILNESKKYTDDMIEPILNLEWIVPKSQEKSSKSMAIDSDYIDYDIITSFQFKNSKKVNGIPLDENELVIETDDKYKLLLDFNKLIELNKNNNVEIEKLKNEIKNMNKYDHKKSNEISYANNQTELGAALKSIADLKKELSDSKKEFINLNAKYQELTEDFKSLVLAIEEAK